MLRADAGPHRPDESAVVRGADLVAKRAILFSRPSATLHPAIVNGTTGVVVSAGDAIVSVMAFTVVGTHIVAIDTILDPDRLAAIDASPYRPT